MRYYYSPDKAAKDFWIIAKSNFQIPVGGYKSPVRRATQCPGNLIRIMEQYGPTHLQTTWA